MRLATRAALTNLVEAAIEERVAFVVLAGDLYDGDWQDFGTGLFFCAAMGRLEAAGVAAYLLHGNHDAESVLTRRLPLPANVRVFGARRPTSFIHAPTGAALHGWSYRERDIRENLAAGYPAALPGRCNIGVLHTALAGRAPHESYAPCSTGDLAAKGYDYWALGHVHAFEVVSRDPPIVFPGNLQGRNIRETGPKGAVLVTVGEDGAVSRIERLVLDTVRWAAIEIDLTGVESDAELHHRLRGGLSRAWSEASEGRALMLRVTLTGATALHGALAARREALREETRGMAVAISERLWIEKVRSRTTGPAMAGGADPTLRDELAGLLALGQGDAALRAALSAELDEFLARTPPDLGSDDEALAGPRRGDLDALLREAAEALDARLAGEAG